MTRTVNPTAEEHLRARAEAAVSAIAAQYGAKLTPWRRSVSPEWEYAKLIVGEQSFTVGASTAGLISVNADPFSAAERRTALTPQAILDIARKRMARSHYPILAA
jgi:hypothetical protein